MSDRYFEDFKKGERFVSAGLTITESAIIDFARRYVALQRNGFDDAPAALLKRFMQIDLDDPATLVRGATGLIAERSATLAGLYAR